MVWPSKFRREKKYTEASKPVDTGRTASRGHLCDSTAFLLFYQASSTRAFLSSDR